MSPAAAAGPAARLGRDRAPRSDPGAPRPAAVAPAAAALPAARTGRLQGLAPAGGLPAAQSRAIRRRRRRCARHCCR
ncbi:MAG: hypothetical protein DCF23_08415 [Cyanobium sp.]|nr:MAG: hypothetical protein DCF23_08415 [Cyanobium sp.]